jgi:hypothetical protein
LLVALLPRLGILVSLLFLFLCSWKWIFFLLFLLVDTFDVLLPGTCYFLAANCLLVTACRGFPLPAVVGEVGSMASRSS